MTIIKYFKTLIFLATLLFAFLTAVPAGATPLGLTLNPFPDIFSSFIFMKYIEHDEEFSADGSALTLNDGSSSLDISDGLFSLDAQINSSGVFHSGTLTIGGRVLEGPATGSGPLLTGDLTAFGFGGTDDPLEFLFNVTGGAASDLYGGIGATGGVILSSTYTTFNGAFTSDWLSLAVSDTSHTGTPIPEPGTVFLLGIGLIGIARFSRKK